MRSVTVIPRDECVVAGNARLPIQPAMDFACDDQVARRIESNAIRMRVVGRIPGDPSPLQRARRIILRDHGTIAITRAPIVHTIELSGRIARNENVARRIRGYTE